MIEVREYIPAGRSASVFGEWFLGLDTRARQLVDDAIARMRLGNMGACKRVGSGVLERRIDSGPGYRIYFGREGDNLILKLSGQRINSLQCQLKRLDRAIADHMRPITQTLNTIPGIGEVFASGIIAEIGGVARFEYDQAKVANYAGFKWRQRQSANFQAAHTPMTRSGNRYLRYYFCEAANSVRMHDAEYKAYYQKKFNEVRSHQHKRATVLTARKLVRLVVRLLTTNQTYRPRRM